VAGFPAGGTVFASAPAPATPQMPDNESMGDRCDGAGVCASLSNHLSRVHKIKTPGPAEEMNDDQDN
jgi:hypothetical protein